MLDQELMRYRGRVREGVEENKVLRVLYEKAMDPERAKGLTFEEIWLLHNRGWISLNQARTLAGLDEPQDRHSTPLGRVEVEEDEQGLKPTRIMMVDEVRHFKETDAHINWMRPVDVELDEPESTLTSSLSTPGTTSPSTLTWRERSSSSTNSDWLALETGRESSFVSLREITGFY